MTRLAAFLFLTIVTAGTLYAEARPKPTLADGLNKKWTALHLGLTHFGGDYVSYGPYVLIQRLPDDRFLLSVQKHSNKKGGIPVPVRFVSEKEVNKWTTTLAKILTAASTEEAYHQKVKKLPKVEQEKIRKEHGFGISSSMMEIRLGSSEFSRVYGSEFDEDKATLGEFVTFAKQLIEPPQ